MHTFPRYYNTSLYSLPDLDQMVQYRKIKTRHKVQLIYTEYAWINNCYIVSMVTKTLTVKIALHKSTYSNGMLWIVRY